MLTKNSNTNEKDAESTLRHKKSIEPGNNNVINSKCDFEIISLDEIMYGAGEKYVRSIIDDYKCVNPESDHLFLKKWAIEFNKRDISKTYLAIDEDDKIMGYFNIGIKCFHLPKDDIYQMHDIYKLMNPYGGIVQSYLIGQLSRSVDSSRGLGSEMLKKAIGILNYHRKGIGCRVVRLQCYDSLLKYYENNGFVKIKKDEKSDLNEMIRILSRQEIV